MPRRSVSAVVCECGGSQYEAPPLPPATPLASVFDTTNYILTDDAGSPSPLVRKSMVHTPIPIGSRHPRSLHPLVRFPLVRWWMQMYGHGGDGFCTRQPKRNHMAAAAILHLKGNMVEITEPGGDDIRLGGDDI